MASGNNSCGQRQPQTSSHRGRRIYPNVVSAVTLGHQHLLKLDRQDNLRSMHAHRFSIPKKTTIENIPIMPIFDPRSLTEAVAKGSDLCAPLLRYVTRKAGSLRDYVAGPCKYWFADLAGWMRLTLLMRKDGEVIHDIIAFVVIPELPALEGSAHMRGSVFVL
jgi:hypothetical protein